MPRKINSPLSNRHLDYSILLSILLFSFTQHAVRLVAEPASEPSQRVDMEVVSGDADQKSLGPLIENILETSSDEIRVVCEGNAKDCAAVEKEVHQHDANRTHFETAKKEEGLPSKWYQSYKVTYTMARALLGQGAVTYLLWDPHASLAGFVLNNLPNGLNTAAWATAYQLTNKKFLEWQGNRGALHPITLIKNGLYISPYVIATHLMLNATGHDHDLASLHAGLKIMKATGWSLFLQTFWRTLNQKLTSRAIQRDPTKKDLYLKRSAGYSVILAAANITSVVLNAHNRNTGSHLGPGDKFSLVVGGAGLGATGVDYAMKNYRNLLGWVPIFRRRKEQSECEDALAEIAPSVVSTSLGAVEVP